MLLWIVFETNDEVTKWNKLIIVVIVALCFGIFYCYKYVMVFVIAAFMSWYVESLMSLEFDIFLLHRLHLVEWELQKWNIHWDV